MKSAVLLITCLYVSRYSHASIRSSAMLNKLSKVNAVGSPLVREFVPLTEIPPPKLPSNGVYHETPKYHLHKDGRRHYQPPPDCSSTPEPKVVIEGGNINIVGDYYDENFAKTVATVIIPDHIDHLHYEVTTQVPYLTVGPIDGIGFHPTTIVTGECEKIYQDHIADQYSDETREESEESLEMARMPFLFAGTMSPEAQMAEEQYSDK